MNTKKYEFICWDLETKDLIKKGEKISDLQISFLGWYNSKDKEIKVTDELGLPEFFEEVKETDLLIGFNSISFDSAVIEKYDYTEVVKNAQHFDMMKMAQKELGHRVSLNAIAKASLGLSKTAHGSKAPKLWKEGKHDELIRYLKQDIALTKDIYIKGVREGELQFEDKKEPHEIRSFNTKNWLQVSRELMRGFDKVEEVLKEYGHSAAIIEKTLETLRDQTRIPVQGGAPKKRLTSKVIFEKFHQKKNF